MPRGSKRSYEERIDILNQEITKVKEKLDELLKEKENLMVRQEEAEVKSFLSFLHDNNLSIVDVKNQFMVMK